MTQNIPRFRRVPNRIPLLAALLLCAPGAVYGQVLLEHRFDARAEGEAVASITAGCDCNWGAAGREAVALTLSLDGRYSQHVLLTRGEALSEYRVLLGRVAPGAHRLTIERDPERSAAEAGEARLGAVRIEVFGADTIEHEWLSTAPILHARPGSVERFSDVPLMMYVEAAPRDEPGHLYTVVFSHEDGGTPTDRLMATWGRATDIEFAYGIRRAPDGASPTEEYQGVDHAILPFRGSREGAHPLLWVSTDNNMFSDNGAATAVRFAPAPILVTLDGVSREAVMDRHPWTYAVMAAELGREDRIDPAAQAGSGKVPDPRSFAYLEACGDLHNATLAFEIAVRHAREVTWYATDRGQERFRIARSGCFRAAVPVPPGVTPADLIGIRARSYVAPCDAESPLSECSGGVMLRRVNTVFMLDEAFRPVASSMRQD